MEKPKLQKDKKKMYDCHRPREFIWFSANESFRVINFLFPNKSVKIIHT